MTGPKGSRALCLGALEGMDPGACLGGGGLAWLLLLSLGPKLQCSMECRVQANCAN